MREISLIKKNILHYLDYKGITKYKFYELTGVSNGVLSQKGGFSEENTLRFLSCFKDVNPHWLLTGKGTMLLTDESKKVVDIAQKKGIPLIPIEAMAGFGTGSLQVMEYDTEDYVVPEFDELKVDYLIRIKGSSMYPKYNSGDVVACKRLNLNDLFFQWNKVYVLDTEQGALVKRIHKGQKEDCITLVSDNNKYEPFELHLSKLNAIALVVGVIRLE